MIRTRPPLPLTVLGLAVAFALVGCDAQEAQGEFELAAAQLPSGIARTDADGNLLADDPDDWRTAPLYATSGFRVSSRPYPNPAQINEGVSVLVTTDEGIPGGLRIEAYRGGIRAEIQGQQYDIPPGIHALDFFPGEITGAQPGQLWRLIFFDGQRRVITYGDLQIQ